MQSVQSKQGRFADSTEVGPDTVNDAVEAAADSAGEADVVGGENIEAAVNTQVAVVVARSARGDLGVSNYSTVGAVVDKSHDLVLLADYGATIEDGGLDPQ